VTLNFFIRCQLFNSLLDANSMSQSPPTPFRLAGIIGWPVSHSRSPAIYNHWIKSHGLNGQYVYLPVKPENPHNLRDAVAGMRAMGFAGGNLTMPHKLAVIPLLDYIDPVAKAMGSVNTLAFGVDGALTGYNTDGFGFIQSLLDVKPNWRAADGPVVVLGAGGASRAIVYALLREGATEIRLTNRTQATAQAIADEFGGSIQVVDWASRHEAIADCSTLINTTSQGMHGQSDLDLSLNLLPINALVADAIYVPLETPLLIAARLRGNLTVNGLGMLLNQARPAFNAWFGTMPNITPELLKAVHATF
jgi:shikimate dehydrogenase